MMRALLFMAAALLTACIPHTNAVETGDVNLTVRVIIGFSDPEFDYQHPAFLETLSRKLTAKVTFLKPLSGDAALYLCETGDTKDVLMSRLDRLAKHADIRYAELDQTRKIQNKTD